MREQRVVVAVVTNVAKDFLLTYNEDWGGYAFPMKACGEDDLFRGQLAVEAVLEDIGERCPIATSQPLNHVDAFGASDRTGEETLYEYQTFLVDLGSEYEPTAGGGRTPTYVSYADIQSRRDVTWSTKRIASSFVEDQEAALAVVTRMGKIETEYLVVWKDGYGGYFFPVARVTQTFGPAIVARRAVRQDVGYRGPLDCQCCADTLDVHESKRFDPTGRPRRFRFHVCEVRVPEVDMNRPANPFERPMKGFEPKPLWLTADQLRNPDPPLQFSDTMKAAMPTVLSLLSPRSLAPTNFGSPAGA